MFVTMITKHTTGYHYTDSTQVQRNAFAVLYVFCYYVLLSALCFGSYEPLSIITKHNELFISTLIWRLCRKHGRAHKGRLPGLSTSPNRN
jgi:hypothetical protein